jgi:hypothetical protein
MGGASSAHEIIHKCIKCCSENKKRKELLREQEEEGRIMVSRI